MTRLFLTMLLVFCAGVVQGKIDVEMITINVDTPLNAQRKVKAHMKAGNYDGPIGIKLRGNSSLSFNQKKYTIELRDNDGNEVDAPLMGMPAHSDWVLLAPYNDVSAVRDPLAFQLWRDMGHWGPRTRMVELTLNGEYCGIYILSEAIKRGEQRVKIEEAARSLADSGVNDLLLSVDAFHQESIPLEPVIYFADCAVRSGLPIRLSPAWLVRPEDNNPYNIRTREILREFEPLGIPTGAGNVIFPSGNALKYLQEYFDEKTEYTSPYDEDPEDIRSLSFLPNGDVLNGNVNKTDILEIIRNYSPDVNRRDS